MRINDEEQKEQRTPGMYKPTVMILSQAATHLPASLFKFHIESLFSLRSGTDPVTNCIKLLAKGCRLSREMEDFYVCQRPAENTPSLLVRSLT